MKKFFFWVCAALFFIFSLKMCSKCSSNGSVGAIHAFESRLLHKGSNYSDVKEVLGEAKSIIKVGDDYQILAYSDGPDWCYVILKRRGSGDLKVVEFISSPGRELTLSEKKNMVESLFIDKDMEGRDYDDLELSEAKTQWVDEFEDEYNRTESKQVKNKDPKATKYNPKSNNNKLNNPRQQVGNSNKNVSGKTNRSSEQNTSIPQKTTVPAADDNPAFGD